MLGIFAPWRLAAYGGTLAAICALGLGALYWHGLWPADRSGAPHFFDFAVDVWLPAQQALHGHAARLYQGAEFVALQRALFGPQPIYYPHFPYPPTYLLLTAPLAALSFVAAFFTYELASLLACLAVVWRIVRRRAAIVLVLASPFTIYNLLTGQSGFLTASLVGGTLLSLERRPLLAGMFLGALTYKPHLGILFPVALFATKQWRAILAAAATAGFLVGASIAAFGVDPWLEYPAQLFAQTGVNLGSGLAHASLDPRAWGLLQTVYGLARELGGSALVAGLAQAVVTGPVIVVVWRIWRAPVRYALKAATLSAAMFLATPYALAYDMAALAVSVAFLARDQFEHGVRRGEQTVLLALFALGFVIFPSSGRAPIGLAAAAAIFSLAVRRALPLCRAPA